MTARVLSLGAAPTSRKCDCDRGVFPGTTIALAGDIGTTVASTRDALLRGVIPSFDLGYLDFRGDACIEPLDIAMQARRELGPAFFCEASVPARPLSDGDLDKL